MCVLDSPALYVLSTVLAMSTLFISILSSLRTHRDLHSFPTRRSSDLRRTFVSGADARVLGVRERLAAHHVLRATALRARDRKSTRLNSSHVSISYSVFCLKKKKCNLITYFILLTISIWRVASVDVREK